MTSHKAKVHHDPENGAYGDCYRTAIAYILGYAPEEVPHVNHDGCDAVTAENRMCEWLHDAHQLDIVNVPLTAPSVDTVLEGMGTSNPGVYWILVGGRGDIPHAVVCKGGEVVCDPSTGEPGNPLTNPDKATGVYWIKLLVPVALTDRV